MTIFEPFTFTAGFPKKSFLNRFFENSEADLSKLRQVAAKAGAQDRVEFLSFNGLDYPAKYGRGYGEFKLLDFAMNNSRILVSAKNSSILWKVTGRYRVLNIATMVRTAPSHFDLYCDTRLWPIPWWI